MLMNDSENNGNYIRNKIKSIYAYVCSLYYYNKR